MTTTDTASKFRYEGNGTTDTFSFDGRVFETSDIVVDIITRATDVLVETLTETTDYTVTIADNGTASVTVVAGKIPSALQDILLRRSVPQSQSTALPSGTRFPAKTVEDSLDRVTVLTQDLQEQIDRSVKLPQQTSIASVTLPDPVDGTFITWSGSSGNMANSTKTLTQVEAAVDAVTALSAGSGVLVSANDTTVGFLNGKLVAGDAITFTENNDGGNETLTISIADAAIGTGKLTNVTGADANIVTGTSGTASNFIMWNGDGDAVDSGAAASSFATAAQGALADTAVQPADITGFLEYTEGTEQDTSSGSAWDWDSIPADAKRIDLHMKDNSQSSTGNWLIQFKVSGTAVTSGYSATSVSGGGAGVSSTSGFIIRGAGSTITFNGGIITLSREDSSDNTWTVSGGVGRSDAADEASCYGSITLAGAPDGLRLSTTTGNGDAGVANISIYA